MASLKERLVVSEKYSAIPKVLPGRPLTCCNWDEVSIIKAMSMVEREGMSIQKAAEMFGVPPST